MHASSVGRQHRGRAVGSLLAESMECQLHARVCANCGLPDAWLALLHCSCFLLNAAWQTSQLQQQATMQLHTVSTTFYLLFSNILWIEPWLTTQCFLGLYSKTTWTL